MHLRPHITYADDPHAVAATAHVAEVQAAIVRAAEVQVAFARAFAEQAAIVLAFADQAVTRFAVADNCRGAVAGFHAPVADTAADAKAVDTAVDAQVGVQTAVGATAAAEVAADARAADHGFETADDSVHRGLYRDGCCRMNSAAAGAHCLAHHGC